MNLKLLELLVALAALAAIASTFYLYVAKPHTDTLSDQSQHMVTQSADTKLTPTTKDTAQTEYLPTETSPQEIIIEQPDLEPLVVKEILEQLTTYIQTIRSQNRLPALQSSDNLTAVASEILSATSTSSDNTIALEKNYATIVDFRNMTPKEIAETVVRDWTHPGEHRNNLLSLEHTALGIGLQNNANILQIVVVFSK